MAECIFVETNLCTNLALILHPEDGLKLLKEKISKAHLECFPFYGEITVSSFKVRRKAQYYVLSDSITCNLYPFIAKLEGNIFVDVVSGVEGVKLKTKHVAFSKKRKISEIDPIKVEPSDVEKGLNIEGDDELVVLEPALKVVDSLIDNLKNDEPLKDLENDVKMKDLENHETLPTENKTIKEIGECSKSVQPRKKRGSSKTKA